MNRCQFLICVVLLLLMNVTARAANDSERLNIVVLYADDWRHDTLGCAGHPVVKTPRLDQLAQDGFRFTHNCVTTSICGVSRATLFTGQWASRHGNFAFDAFKTPWSETYPGLLRSHGYWVGHVGKWHNGKFPADNFDFAKAYAGKHFIKDEAGNPIHVTQKNERDSLQFLKERPKGKPFCLTLAFFATHAEDGHPKQYLYQPESESLYQNVTIPTPKTATDEHFKLLPPFIANEKNEGRRRWHWRFDSAEKYQEYMKAYYRLATEVDSACGRVIDALKEQGELERTLVIFTTDNGYFHAEHGLADKWYPYQESIRVPLIVRDPRMTKSRKGQTNADFVLNVDLAPTILKAAGISAPERMQGRDFSPLYLSEQRAAWREEFFYEHGTIKNIDFIPSSTALVRKGAKYIYWPDFKHEEFFDLTTDPNEERNRVADPAIKNQLAEMRERYAQLRDAAK